jgi:hypothetical protein
LATDKQKPVYSINIFKTMLAFIFSLKHTLTIPLKFEQKICHIPGEQGDE